eukprot:CAMPEP_0178436946 /NCGR_PEP_ID=MMETSP0689_2-20121128/34709_1 /TAXON_ID=160604 /ORGANISM="Amphidinium massartii, Strain CS-259" /LENGTH=167 /DNA_ID=CAMNT_0020059073 /DNA_START=23 /DNA_END=523 /DNA_ORIENTATION=-
MGNQACCEGDRNAVNVPIVDTMPVAQDLSDSHKDQVVPEIHNVPPVSFAQTTAPAPEPAPAPPIIPEAKEAPVEEVKEPKMEAEPPAAPVTDAKESEEEYTITLQRAGNKLGMLVYNQAGEDFIRVRTVREGWLVDKWNAANPTRALKPGYTIVEVNGKRSADDMRW